MKGYLLAAYILLSNIASGQKYSFILKGSVNIDTGTLLIVPAFGEEYYPENIHLSTQIKKGKFTFQGEISYASPVLLMIKEGGKVKYWSTRFLLDKGTQKAGWKTEMGHSTPVEINNDATRSQQIYQSIFHDNEQHIHEISLALNSLDNGTNVTVIRRTLSTQKDSLIHQREKMILHYMNEHPSSVIPLWNMVFELDKGYVPFLDTFNNNLSEFLKSTVTAKQYAAGVEKLRRTAIGRFFPQLEVIDVNGTKVKLNLNNKYTFIDFWFTGCYPCKRLFPEFEKIYQAYHMQGFEFIAITTDEGDLINSWKKYLHENDLPWQQYRDDNKHNADMLLIERYPTSFLLDGEGKIIAQDMLPEQLEQFLQTSLQ